MAEEAVKARVACFVDGFNLYHAIDELRDENNVASFNHLKWVDLRKLATAFIKPTSQDLVALHYCSAYATYRAGPYARHRAYTAVLEDSGVKLVMGAFKERRVNCKKCGHNWCAHTEKETDVNFAVSVIAGAHAGAFDHAILITADSDQCPTIRYVKANFPKITMQVVTPPGGFDDAHELRSLAPTTKIKRKHLHVSLFPEKIVLKSGKEIARPAEYDPPHSQG